MAIHFGITFVRHFAQIHSTEIEKTICTLHTIYNMSLQIPFKELEVKIYGC